MYVSMVIDRRDRIHLLTVDDPEDDEHYPDIVLHWIRDQQGWQQRGAFRVDSLAIRGIRTVLEDNDVLHLLVGATPDDDMWRGFTRIYYARYEREAWSRPELVERATEGEYFEHLNLGALSGQRLVACWQWGFPHLTARLKYREGGRWSGTLFAVPRFSPKENGFSEEPYLVVGRGDTLHIVFFAEPRGNVWHRTILYACGVPHQAWSTLSEVHFDRKEQPNWLTMAVTPDGCRHVFWAKDLDTDIFPDMLCYSYSRDGRSWSQAAPFTPPGPIGVPLHHPYKVHAVADSAGLLHAVWLYVAWPKEMMYFYRSGREDRWSEPTTLWGENSFNCAYALAVDSHNRLHLAWVSADPVQPHRALLCHSVADLASGHLASSAQASAEGLPHLLSSASVFPNPFSEKAILRIVADQHCLATIAVYDMLGRRVRLLAGDRLLNGEEAHFWDGRDDGGTLLPAGVYFWEVQAWRAGTPRQKEVLRGKLLLVR
ncbi:MAG: hypothetical protein ACUVV3_10670 [Dehalococcoidia bacterium]